MLTAALIGALSSGAAHGGTEQGVTVEGCAIRLLSSGPVIHENGAHDCRGVASVSADGAGDLVIVHSVHGDVVSMVAASDESLAARDVMCGPSGGVTMTVVKCYVDGDHVSVKSSAVASTYSNIWLTRVVVTE